MKAVNPNAVSKVDNRTPREIIQTIEEQGRIVAEALSRLSSLLNYESAPKSNGEKQPNPLNERIPQPSEQHTRQKRKRAHGRVATSPNQLKLIGE